jgi:adenylate cyclase
MESSSPPLPPLPTSPTCCLGRHDPAIDAAEHALTLSRNHTFFLGVAGGVYAAAGRREKADAILADLRTRSPRNYVGDAGVAVALGEIDRAFEWLERAHEDRNPNLLSIGVAASWDPLRGDPRFGALLKKVGLEGVLPASG